MMKLINKHLISLHSSLNLKNLKNPNNNIETFPLFLSSSSTTYPHYNNDTSNNHMNKSMFSIGKLKLLLCFILILTISTSFYCLVSYNNQQYPLFMNYNYAEHYHRRYPAILIYNKNNSNNDIDNGDNNEKLSSSTNSLMNLLKSKQLIVDKFIHSLNEYYLDYFRAMLSSSTSSTVPNNINDKRSLELFKLIQMIENLTNFNDNSNLFADHDNSKKHSHDNNNNYLNYLNNYDLNNENLDDDNIDDISDDDDLNDIEYQLKHLGFNFKHIVYLYARLKPFNLTLLDSKFTESLQTDSLLKSIEHYDRNGHNQRKHRKDFVKSQNFSRILPHQFIDSTIVLTAINSKQFQLGTSFIKSFEIFCSNNNVSNNNLSNYELMIYDLGLYPHQLKTIEKLCRKSRIDDTRRNLCTIRTFQFNDYPSHVSDLRMAAYRSIIIQEMLRDIKLTRQYYSSRNSFENIEDDDNHQQQMTTIIWLDPQYHLIENKQSLIRQLQIKILNQSGIISWPIEQPTSSLTHPRMFEYFHTTKENFFFHRMIRSGHLMIVLNNQTWNPFEWGIMLPWVNCALNSDCLAPLGSQWRTTCRLDKKPHYRFSGCHHYDMSALNIVLGIAFNYSSSTYSMNLSKQFFWPFNKPKPIEKQQNIDDSNDDDDDVFDYQFENNKYSQSNTISFGRYDTVMNDDDVPVTSTVESKKRKQQQQHSKLNNSIKTFNY